MATMTTKQAAQALRRAARAVDLSTRFRPDRTAAETCKLLAAALSDIQDAQIVVRNDACWRERTEADIAAMRQR